jgi:hypothetical protein
MTETIVVRFYQCLTEGIVAHFYQCPTENIVPLLGFRQSGLSHLGHIRGGLPLLLLRVPELHGASHLVLHQASQDEHGVSHHRAGRLLSAPTRYVVFVKNLTSQTFWAASGVMYCTASPDPIRSTYLRKLL